MRIPPGRLASLLVLPFVAAFAVLLASCAQPPASAYEQSSSAPSGGIAVGQNQAGESCTMQRQGSSAAIYCGTYEQPSAHAEAGGTADPAALVSLATTSAWRAGIEASYACGDPTATRILDGIPAVELSCTQRFGGWPHVALVASIDGRAWYGDGVLPALPALQRAIDVLSGRVPAGQASQAAVAVDTGLLASRLAAEAFSSGDVGKYEALMQLGARANQAENFSAAATAYRAALALQQQKLGHDDPATVAPLSDLALQLSDLGQYADADPLFAQAALLAPASADPTALPRLHHFEALDQINRGNNAKALALLRQAESEYEALLPSGALTPRATDTTNDALASLTDADVAIASSADNQVPYSPVQQAALVGVIETLRYQAVAELDEGHKAASATLMSRAIQIATSNDIAPPVLAARIARTKATIDFEQGHAAAAASTLAAAAADFQRALPNSRPVAETKLLRAATLVEAGQVGDAVDQCRQGIALLRQNQLGTDPALIGPCLDAFYRRAGADPAEAAALHVEMFEAAELAQGTTTTREIAEAAARLATGAKDPKVASAIRAEQDAKAKLAALYQQRDQLANATPAANAAAGAAALAALDKQIAAATDRLSQTELAVQAAAPNYGQLVQQVVPAEAVLKLLRPDEAFLGITLTPDATYDFLLHGGAVDVARSSLSASLIGRLVHKVRTSVEPTEQGVPQYDMADAHALYGATLGAFPTLPAGLKELVIAPSGPLLTIPFAMLPTETATDANLSAAPWLVRKVTLAEVPAAANFVSLRRIEGQSRAPDPYFGFGDFQPASLTQASATFSGPACAQSAQLFAGLPPLPYAALELKAGAAVFGAGPQDLLTGANFTANAVEKADLAQYRILHFATHALLPTDLPCENSPAIVTSTPPGATSADGALLTDGDIANLKLDANLVVLSACNTGGGDEASGGEALSGLARSFFFAGARALLVTQWSVNDQVSAYIVADTLQRLHAAGGGAAASLRSAQLALIDGAGKNGSPAQLADPFYWAAFTVIGDGGSSANSRLSEASDSVSTGL